MTEANTSTTLWSRKQTSQTQTTAAHLRTRATAAHLRTRATAAHLRTQVTGHTVGDTGLTTGQTLKRIMGQTSFLRNKTTTGLCRGNSSCETLSVCLKWTWTKRVNTQCPIHT
ncbi:hypothetical protein NQD34_005693 [Periophthalmus magnuspinnatus]|nr:hypothetical protein NQD34_005693 [Periophthalmus magnuspinnatus]